MSTASPGPRLENSRRYPTAGPGLFSRMLAGLLTAVLYALLALLAWWSSMTAPPTPAPTEITATVLRDAPTTRVAEKLPVFLAHLIRPHAETPASPNFAIAPDAPSQSAATLPASSTKSSSMQGGAAGTDQTGQRDQGNGTRGNGDLLAGCLDPIWQRALADRVKQFFFWPEQAVSSHKTGVVLIHIIVHRDGHLSALNIAKSSGAAVLDQAAYDIVHSAQPLPRFPDRMHVERIDGELAMNFGVRDFHAAVATGHCD